MTISVVTTSSSKTWAKVKFFYAHALSDLTATSTASGYDVEDILNRLETNKWVSNVTSTQYITFDAGAGETVACDYGIIVGHNFATAGVTYTWQYSTDNFSSDINDAHTAATADSDDDVLLQEFTSQTKRYWRLKIENATDEPEITIAYCGEKTELDYCHGDFNPSALDSRDVVNTSQTGYVTGVYTKYVKRTATFVFEDIDDDLFDKLETWFNAIGRENFVIAWETEEHSGEVYLMRLAGGFNFVYTDQARSRKGTLSFEGRKA